MRAAWSSCPAASTSTPTSPAPASIWRGGCCRRSTTPIPRQRPICSTASRSRSLRHRRHGAEHVHDRLSLRRASATRRCSTPPSRRYPPALSHAEFDDTPIVDGGFFVLLGNDDYLLRLHRRRRARRRRAITPRGCWRRPAATRSRSSTPAASSCGSAARRARTELDTPIGSSARHAARDSRDARRRGERSFGLPHAAHIHCNNLGASGQRDDHARQHARGRRTARALHAPAVPQLRRRPTDGGWRSGARELIEYINAHPDVSGDVGQVMFGAGDDAHGRWSGGVPAAQEQRPQVGERGRRARDRLRHRAVQLQGEGGGRRAAVGGRARAVPAVRRSVAGRALDRSSRTAGRSCRIRS